jgi:hypothetical protein
MKKLVALAAAVLLAACGNITGPDDPAEREAQARAKWMLESASQQPTVPNFGKSLN